MNKSILVCGLPTFAYYLSNTIEAQIHSADDLDKGIDEFNPFIAIAHASKVLESECLNQCHVIAFGADHQQAIATLKHGACDYIHLPFDLEEQMLRLKIILSKYKSKAEVYSVAGITINESTRSVLDGEKKIHLTPLEFDILLALAKRKAISFANLQRYVWGEMVGINVISVHVGNLNKKLGHKIRSIRCYGYTLTHSNET